MNPRRAFKSHQIRPATRGSCSVVCLSLWPDSRLFLRTPTNSRHVGHLVAPGGPSGSVVLCVEVLAHNVATSSWGVYNTADSSRLGNERKLRECYFPLCKANHVRTLTCDLRILLLKNSNSSTHADGLDFFNFSCTLLLAAGAAMHMPDKLCSLLTACAKSASSDTVCALPSPDSGCPTMNTLPQAATLGINKRSPEQSGSHMIHVVTSVLPVRPILPMPQSTSRNAAALRVRR